MICINGIIKLNIFFRHCSSLHAGKFHIVFFVICRFLLDALKKSSIKHHLFIIKVWIQIRPDVFFFLPDLGPNCLQGEQQTPLAGKELTHISPKRPFIGYRQTVQTQIRPQGYKTFFMLNSTKQEIYPAHKN